MQPQRPLRNLFGAALALGFAASAAAQVSYPTESFAANAAGWTGFGHFTGATACGGSGGAIRYNLYDGDPTASLVSPLLGSANGGAITLNYDYKCANWPSNNTPASVPWGSFNVQYASSPSGPWTTISTVTNETQNPSPVPCSSKSVLFTPPVGPVFVRFDAMWMAGDYYLNFDNISAIETTSGCSGTPAPGNTVGPSEACPGAAFTLSLQNSTPGTGISYQWEHAPSNTGPWMPLGTAPTQVISQTMDTWYRCRVACGASTGISTPALVLVSVPTFPRTFETGGIIGNCWSISGSELPYIAAVSGYGIGTAAARFDFWNWLAGATPVLTSPVFAPVAVGDRIYFDVAGTQWSGDPTAIDQITLEESADGGSTWTPVVVMNNSASGVLRTASPVNAPFFPTASQWASLAYPLSTGTNRVRFAGLANFGNNVFLDNISVGVLPSARHSNYGAPCAVGYRVTAAPAPVAGTTFTYSQVGIPEAAPASGIYFGVVVVSLGQDFVGTPLNLLTAGLVDSPCNLNVTSLDLLLAFISATPADSSVTFAVPAGAPAGFLLYSQAAAVIAPVAPNNAGIVTSNAIRSYINSF